MNKEELSKELDGLVHPFVSMVTVDTTNYLEASIHTAKKLSEKYKGIYVTINRPYAKIKQLLEKEGVDTSKLMFIDAITAVAVPEVKSDESVSYITHPSDITLISATIGDFLEKITEDKFLLIDSISTLTVYNTSETITKFLHQLSSRLAVTNSSAVFISLKEETDKTLLGVTSQFCDKIINY